MIRTATAIALALGVAGCTSSKKPPAAPISNEATTTAPPSSTPDEDCDEVSCVLMNYELACCAAFDHRTEAAGQIPARSAPKKAGPPPDSLPDTADPCDGGE